MCETEGLLVLNLGVFGLELRNFWGDKEWPFCVELTCSTEEGYRTEGDPFVGVNLGYNFLFKIKPVWP